MKDIFYIPYSDFVIAILLFILSLKFGDRGVSAIIGIIFFFPSMVLWFLAKKQLGKAFRVKPQAVFFVKEGLYSKIKHPIYFFSSLAFLGILILFWKLYLIPLYVLLVIVQFIRAIAEEKRLIKRFGDEYIKYKDKTIF